MNAINPEFISRMNKTTRDDLKLTLSPVPEFSRIIVIELAGQIDTYSSTYLENQIDMVLDYGYTEIIFEITDTKFVSAMGLCSLKSIQKKIIGHGGSFVLTGMQQNVLEVFQLSKFIGLFTIKEDIHSAVLSFDKREEHDEE